MIERKWKLGQGRSLTLDLRSRVMGIVNVTPDSFSDGGDALDISHAMVRIDGLIADGADILDIGGESTRPGAEPVSPEIEQSRVIPVIAALSKRNKQEPIVSVDTYRVATARLALDAGAHIVNDVWGLQREPDIANLAAEHKAGLVIMHSSRDRDVHPDPIEDQKIFLSRSLEIAAKAGVSDDAIVLDPGFGFGKNAEQDIALMARCDELLMFGFPILIGTSRKRFLGSLTGRVEPKDRDIATSATSALLRAMGMSVFRVHNVAASRDALAIADAMVSQQIQD